MYKLGSNPFNADDSPFYASWLGTSSDWSCDDWVIWHKALLAKYGEQKAHDVWMSNWNKQSYWGFNKSWCKYQTGFNDYVKANHLDVSNFIANATVATEKVISTTVDSLGNTIIVLIDSAGNLVTRIVDSTGKLISETIDGVTRTVKAASYIIPLAIVATVAVVLAVAHGHGGKVAETIAAK